ncbi:hypothetical protein J7L48_02675 [bacterium]|nr:hypothetical protein [bacterium]
MKYRFRKFKDIEIFLKKNIHKVNIILVSAHDNEPLISISKAVKKGLCNGTLVGNKKEIKKILKEMDTDHKLFKIVDASSDIEVMDRSIEILHKEKNSILMKGLISTQIFMKKVLSKEADLRTGRTISHSFVFENPFSKKFTIITDGGIVPFPTYEQKKELIENSMQVAHSFGLKKVKIAMLSASEKVTAKIPSTVEFDNLKREYIDRHDLIIDGPFGIDVAIRKSSALHKGIKTPVSQNADIWLVPSVEAGNMAAKAILYFGKVKAAGLIAGSKVPIILLSRADDSKTRYNSILLGLIALRSFK